MNQNSISLLISLFPFRLHSDPPSIPIENVDKIYENIQSRSYKSHVWYFDMYR